MPCSWIRSLSLLFLSLLVFDGSAFGEATSQLGIQRANFSAGNQHLVIEAFDDDLVHFEYSVGNSPPQNQAIWISPMVAKLDYPGPSSFRRHPDGVETGELKVQVERDSICVSVFDKKRNQHLNRICPMNLHRPWKGLSVDSPSTRNVYGLGQYFTNPGTADGDWMGRVWDPTADSHGHKLRPFSGGANTYALFPIAYALGEGKQSYAIFVDQVYKQMWSLNQSPWKVEMFGDQIRWFILSGEDLADLRRDYMELTGRPPVPPKSSFGLWVSEFGYENFGEIYDDLLSLERNHFPVDGFALDIQWFGGRFYSRGDDVRDSRFGTLRFDEASFPGFEREIRHLRRDRGVRLMAIEESYVSKYLDEHWQLERRGFLARECPYGAPIYLDANPWWGVGGMIDWTNGSAGDFWHDYKRQYLVNLGIHHHWTDLGEPEMYSDRACYNGFPELGKHGHADIHNIYNLRWAESIQRGYQRNQVRDRPFVMTRAGTSGIQRTGAAMWSGDIGANMGALTAHLNAQMHMSFSGVDYYGSDIGGFHRRPDTLDGDANALFTQWFANSAMFDFPVRSHTWNLANNLETAPSKIGDMRSNLANIRLRYELFPYYYSLAHQASRAGDPVIPPLVYWYPEDRNVRTLGNIKMIGRDLLAAVVASYGQTGRKVYLPRGKWAEFHSNRWIESGGEEHGPFDVYVNGVFRLPLFARAGAIIPMQWVDEQTGNISGFRRDGTKRHDLRVRVFSSEAETQFTLIEDDGESQDYARGQVAETRISQKREGQRAWVVVDGTQGQYLGASNQRNLQIEWVVDGEVGTSVQFNGRVLPQCSEAFGPGSPRDCWKNTGENLIHVSVGPQPVTETKRFEIELRRE